MAPCGRRTFIPTVTSPSTALAWPLAALIARRSLSLPCLVDYGRSLAALHFAPSDSSGFGRKALPTPTIYPYSEADHMLPMALLRFHTLTFSNAFCTRLFPGRHTSREAIPPPSIRRRSRAAIRLTSPTRPHYPKMVRVCTAGTSTQAPKRGTIRPPYWTYVAFVGIQRNALPSRVKTCILYCASWLIW